MSDPLLSNKVCCYTDVKSVAHNIFRILVLKPRDLESYGIALLRCGFDQVSSIGDTRFVLDLHPQLTCILVACMKMLNESALATLS